MEPKSMMKKFVKIAVVVLVPVLLILKLMVNFLMPQQELFPERKLRNGIAMGEVFVLHRQQMNLRWV
jgi:hypothetical protein